MQEKLRAVMNEYDTLGHDEFISKYKEQYNFGSPRTYFVMYKNTLYPLKIIYRVAAKDNQNLTSVEYAGRIVKLGFEIFHIENKEENEYFFETLPKTSNITIKVYKRNADTREAVLKRAGGICEACKKEAPFYDKDGEPFLEVHHKIYLSQNGEDVPNNCEALCPNCHREKHFGKKL